MSNTRMGLRDFRTANRFHLCVQDSVVLAKGDKWTNPEPGEFVTVRLNFLVEVSHASTKPTAYLAAPMADITNRSRVRSPFGPVDQVHLASQVVEPSILNAVEAAVLQLGPKDKHRESLKDAIHTICVSNSRRPDSDSPNDEVAAKRAGPYKLRIREDASSGSPVLFAPRTATLHLTHVDYLMVSYRSTLLGRRIIRHKRPPFSEDHVGRANEVNTDGFPYATLQWLDPVAVGEPGKKLTPVTERDIAHATLIDSPSEPISDAKEALKKVPTLYKVSNAAFVMPPDAERKRWTEDQLAALRMGPNKLKAWRNAQRRADQA